MATSFAARPPTGLTVDVHQDGKALVVRAEGEIDMGNVDALKNDLAQAFEGHATAIVFDLEGVRFIDSTGLRLLLWAANRSQEDGDRLCIRCGAGAVRRVLELTNLDRSLPLAA